MFRRILSLLGLSWYVPSGALLGAAAARSSGSAGEEPDVEGQATVRFTPGLKAAPLAAETEESLNEQRDRLTQRELIWPGKTSQLIYQNSSPLAYRFALTLTDLDPAYYTVRPPIGGAYQPDGSVLLQPEEKTTFEVAFHEPLSSEKARSRLFSYVITSFDPRRANDPGEIEEDVPMRWAPLPAPTDFKISAEPAHLILRPWRRGAQFALNLSNKSEIPPSVHLKIERAETKQALLEEPQEVGEWSNTLEARRAGTLHCVLPAWPKRSGYVAMVTGIARVTDKTEYALALPKPIYISYVPWLKMARDWVFLFCMLFLLLLIVWGIPIPETPVAYLDVVGLDVAGLSAQDIKIKPHLINGPSSEPRDAVDYDPNSNSQFVIKLPRRWLGYRPFIGWNSEVKQPESFQAEVVNASDANEDKKAKLEKFDQYLETGDNHHPITTHFVIPPPQSLFAAWQWTFKAKMHYSQGIRLDVYLDNLGAITYDAAKNKTIKIICKYNDTPIDATMAPVPDRGTGLLASGVDLKSDKAGQVFVSAEIEGLQVKANPWTYWKQPQSQPYQVHLSFPNLIRLNEKPPLPCEAGKPFLIPAKSVMKDPLVLVNGKSDGRVTAEGVRIPSVPKRPAINVAVKERNGSETINMGSFHVSIPIDHTKELRQLDDSAYTHLRKFELPEAQSTAEKALRIDDNDAMAHAVHVYALLRAKYSQGDSETDRLNNDAIDSIEPELNKTLKLTEGKQGQARALALGVSAWINEGRDDSQAASDYRVAYKAYHEPIIYFAYAFFLARHSNWTQASEIISKTPQDMRSRPHYKEMYDYVTHRNQ